MQSELKSLSKIFSESIFRIPDYQRGYSWGEKQLKDFWSDIEQLPEGKNHYTGVLTLEPTQESDYKKWESDLWIIESKKYSPLYVVDGQQRLTTAVILVQALLDRLADPEQLNYSTKAEIRKKFIFESKDGGISRSYIFGYEKDNPSHNFLRAGIFGEKNDFHIPPDHTVYTANLDTAKKFFAEKLKDFSREQLEVVFTKLTLHFQFNIFYIEPELDVFVTFETMNNRGKPLSHLELLKNRLIYLSTKFEVDKSEREELRRAINDCWMTVYEFLGKTASKRLSDDLFLRTHFICYFGPNLPKKAREEGDEELYQIQRLTDRNDGFKDYLLDEVFTTRRVLGIDKKDPISIKDLHRYAEDIRDTIKTYFAVASPDHADCSFEERVLLGQLSRLDHGSFSLFAVAVMRSIKEPDRREKLLNATERAGFLFRLRSYSFTSNGFDLEQDAIRLVAGDRTAEDLTRKFESISDRFVSSSDFGDAIRGIGKSGGYYYSWGLLRYFMYEYEQHLRARSKTTRQLLDWTTYRAETYKQDHSSIEHIYPQRALDPYWKEQFKDFQMNEKTILRNTLGNLMPVSSPKNSALSNRSFEVKKGSASNQVGYRYGCLTEIQVAHEQNWGPEEILRRGVHLLRFMSDRWRIPMGDDVVKAKLLGLEFVAARVGKGVQAITEPGLAEPAVENQPVSRVVRVRRAPLPVKPGSA